MPGVAALVPEHILCFAPVETSSFLRDTENTKHSVWTMHTCRCLSVCCQACEPHNALTGQNRNLLTSEVEDVSDLIVHLQNECQGHRVYDYHHCICLVLFKQVEYTTRGKHSKRAKEL